MQTTASFGSYFRTFHVTRTLEYLVWNETYYYRYYILPARAWKHTMYLPLLGLIQSVEIIDFLGLKFYMMWIPSSFSRRLLQMSVCNSELYNNLGMCCFYAQQYDMTLTCFERALSLATDDLTIAEVWYNIGHVALVSNKLHCVNN